MRNLIGLKEYTLLEDIKTVFSNYWENHDLNTWLNETYEDYCINGGLLTEEEYYNDKYVNYLYNWDIPHYNLWRDIVYERLDDSFKLTDKNCKTITNFKGITDLDIIHNSKQYKFKITFNDEFNEKDFTTLMNFYNYAKDTKSNNTITYEAVKPVELKYKNSFVYHVTHKSAWQKIQKYGLIPKQQPRHNQQFIDDNKLGIEYPSRIYVFSSDADINILQSFGRLTNRLHNRNVSDIIILKIQVNNIKLYSDPAHNINSAMFTMEPISKNSIELLNNINEAREDIDSEWLDNEKPVQTKDGRQVIVVNVDMSQVPNIIKGKVKMKEKLYDYEWMDDGTCSKALDQMGNPKKPDDADKLIKVL